MKGFAGDVGFNDGLAHGPGGLANEFPFDFAAVCELLVEFVLVGALELDRVEDLLVVSLVLLVVALHLIYKALDPGHPGQELADVVERTDFLLHFRRYDLVLDLLQVVDLLLVLRDLLRLPFLKRVLPTRHQLRAVQVLQDLHLLLAQVLRVLDVLHDAVVVRRRNQLEVRVLLCRHLRLLRPLIPIPQERRLALLLELVHPIQQDLIHPPQLVDLPDDLLLPNGHLRRVVDPLLLLSDQLVPLDREEKQKDVDVFDQLLVGDLLDQQHALLRLSDHILLLVLLLLLQLLQFLLLLLADLLHALFLLPLHPLLDHPLVLQLLLPPEPLLLLATVVLQLDLEGDLLLVGSLRQLQSVELIPTRPSLRRFDLPLDRKLRIGRTLFIAVQQFGLLDLQVRQRLVFQRRAVQMEAVRVLGYRLLINLRFLADPDYLPNQSHQLVVVRVRFMHEIQNQLLYFIVGQVNVAVLLHFVHHQQFDALLKLICQTLHVIDFSQQRIVAALTVNHPFEFRLRTHTIHNLQRQFRLFTHLLKYRRAVVY